VIDRETLVDGYVHRGRTLVEVGDELGVSSSTVLRWLRRHEIPRRASGPRTDRRSYQQPSEVLTRRFLLRTYQRRGMSAHQIADHIGFSKDTVVRYLRHYGFPVTPGYRGGAQPRFVLNPEEISRLRHQGLTVVEIAERLGCSKRTVERAISCYGIER
jgi:transposase